MADWPSSLPQEGFLPQDDVRVDARLRTRMDAGREKVRRRYSATTRQITIPMRLTGTQRQTLDTFYNDTLKEGSLSFNWTDPVDDSAVSMRFLSPPRFRVILGGTTSNREWRATLRLEILP